MKKALLLLLSLQLSTSFAFANEDETKSSLLLEVDRAKILNRVDPKYPSSAAMRQQEGWVELSYVIDRNGEVIDPVVTDSSGEPEFEKSARRAIGKWKFEPALQNGKPIQQCDTKVRIEFFLGEETEKGVRQEFRRLYVKANEAVTADNLEESKELLEKIKSKKIWNRAENAWFWLLSSRVAELEQNNAEELWSLYRANSGIEEDFLGEANYDFNLYKIFILELQAQKYASAFETYQTLSARENAGPYIEEVKPYVAQLEEILASDKALVLTLEIGERGIVLHELYRNSFAVENVTGEVDMLDIRCQNKRHKYSFSTDTQWTIPKSWGKCSVLFEGDEGSSFEIVEVNDVEKSEA